MNKSIKEQILALTGMSEKEFYKSFPTQESLIAKYGKKVEKLLNGGAVKKAQTGQEFDLNGNFKVSPAPLEMETYDFAGNQKAIDKAASKVRRQNLRQGIGLDSQQGLMDESIQKQGFLQGLRDDVSKMDSDDVQLGFQAASSIGGSIQRYAAARAAKKKAKETGEQLREFSPLIAQANSSMSEIPEREYLRPDKYFIQSGTLNNPMGSGPGLYAKNGTEIANTFAPNTIYTDLEKMEGGGAAGLIPEAINTVGDMAAWFGGMNTRKLQRENEKMMSQMGMQPGIQNINSQYVSHMENGGFVNPQIAKSLEGIPMKRLFAPDPTMDTLRTGGNIRQNNMVMNGKLKVDERGDIDFMAYNPEAAKRGASGYIGTSRGPSHAKGGFNVAYGDKVFEMEGNETVLEKKNGASIDDKSLNVLGNLKIGMFAPAVMEGINESVSKKVLKGRDPKDVKYKHLGNDVAKLTKSLNNEQSRYQRLLESSDDDDDLLKMGSVKAGYTGLQMMYKDLDKLTDNMINVQQAVNDTAEEFGIEDPETLYKPGKKLAKMGAKISTARKGATTDEKETPRNGIRPGAMNFKYGLDNFKLDYEPIDYVSDITFKGDSETSDKKIDWFDIGRDAFNQVRPFILPSNAEGLAIEQVAPEYAALAQNQVGRVQAQKLPLRTMPMQNISFDRDRAEAASSYRAMQRLAPYNQALLANLAAGKYAADRAISDAEFKANQQVFEKTLGYNLDAMNKNDLANLGILDQQYVRQQQALSNTKAVQQAALNSINAKILQNRNLNKSLQTFENLYNFRFTPGMRAYNVNPLAEFNMEGSGGEYGIPGIGGMDLEDLEYLLAKKKYEEKQQKRILKDSKDSKGARNGSIVAAVNMKKYNK